MNRPRHSTGNPQLDDLLGGGLLPGTLTVVAGATGIGKTQLGVTFAHHGAVQEGRTGLVFDVSSRGDSQSHAEYAHRICDWSLEEMTPQTPWSTDDFFSSPRLGDYLHLFSYSGRRVTRQDVDYDQWHDWQTELNAKLQDAIAFIYGGFVGGARRLVVDGIEPVDRPHDSIQFNLFEYVYHQIVRKDPEWVARDLFRQSYRAMSDLATEHSYDHKNVSCLLLYTSHETMLDDLIARPLDEGDVLSNANTLILMGKVREGNRVGRALYIAKHRGSACDESIVPYTIGEQGLEL